MYQLILNMYRLLFGRKFFYRFNKLIYRLSLHGLGILNYETDKKSGEYYFISHELKAISGGIVIDVGANIGHYCSIIKSLNSSFDIYAFEPHPTTYKRLEMNTQNIGVRIFNLGVGADEGLLTLYDYASNDGSEHASLHKGVIEQIHKGVVVEHKVRVVALDGFMSQNTL
jgi:FkbM family methyltransferase